MGLRSRFAHGLYARVASFLQSSRFCMDENIEIGVSSELAVALWAIEEWIWLMETSAREGIREIGAGLQAHFREIQKL